MKFMLESEADYMRLLDQLSKVSFNSLPSHNEALPGQLPTSIMA